MYAVVDWMRFWLKGEIPADKEKAERWLPLRKQQEVVNAGLAAKGERWNPLPQLVTADGRPYAEPQESKTAGNR